MKKSINVHKYELMKMIGERDALNKRIAWKKKLIKDMYTEQIEGKILYNQTVKNIKRMLGKT